VLVDDSERVGAVDLRVDDGLQVSGSVVFRPEAEDFEARAGLGVVDDIECFAFAVVLDTQRVEVCLGRGEVEKLKGLRLGAMRGVVIEVKLALVLWTFEDALVKMLGETMSQKVLVTEHCSGSIESHPVISPYRYMK
jgi:hypothetical protein